MINTKLAYSVIKVYTDWPEGHFSRVPSVAQLMAGIQETRQGASDNKENKLVQVTCLSLIK